MLDSLYIKIGCFLDVMNQDVVHGAGTFIKDLSSPQCRAYTWALQMKKSITSPFCSPP